MPLASTPALAIASCAAGLADPVRRLQREYLEACAALEEG